MRRAPTAPQPRGVNNDERVHHAILGTLQQHGWPGFTLRNVAQAAGVARQTVTDRHPTRAHMAIHAWQSALHKPLRQALSDLLSAHQLLTPPGTHPPAEAWRAFSEPTEELKSGLELLLQTPYDDELRTTIATTLGATATDWTAHNRSGAPRQRAAQRAYLIARALGLLALARIHDLSPYDFAPTEQAIVEALERPARASRIGLNHAPRLQIATGNERLDALLMSTIDHVAQHGYEEASIDAICHHAQVSKGFLFHHYPNKQALFIDAARRRQRTALESSMQWLSELAARQGRARAEATFVRAALHPDRTISHRIAAEELRLSAREKDLAQNSLDIIQNVATSSLGALTPTTLGYAASTRAVGEGIGLLTLLEPNAWQLPFETVLVPLQETLTRAYLG